MRRFTKVVVVLDILLVLALHARPGNTEWLINGLPVCIDPGTLELPKIITDDAGGAIVGWRETHSTYSSDFYLGRIDGSGTVLWTTGAIAVRTQQQFRDEPQIVPNGAGGAFIAWLSNDVPSRVYIQKYNASGNPCWSPPGIVLCAVEPSRKNPMIAADGTGGAIVAWEDFRYSGRTLAFAQRVDAYGNILWTANGVEVCPGSDVQYHIGVTSDGAGGAFIAWTDTRSGAEDIYVQHVHAVGTLLWTTGGAPVCTTSTNQDHPKLVRDGAGGVIIAYLDQWSYPIEIIHVQRLNASGAVQWAAGGVPFRSLYYYMWHTKDYRIIPDGAGGAIIGSDYGTAEEVTAQRFDADGNWLWSEEGVTLCTVGEPRYIDLASDGAGGAIFTWHDHRNDEFDIHAQHIDESGAERWTSGGVPVCTAPEAQTYSRIMSDGAGNSFITWQDDRLGTGPDIFAQHVFFVTGGETPSVPRANFLRQNHPNPFNPMTTIRFGLAEPAHVTLRIYDTAGRLVRVLVNERRAAGRCDITWDGRDGAGRPAASGVYFYKLNAGAFMETKKMVLLR